MRRVRHDTDAFAGLYTSSRSGARGDETSNHEPLTRTDHQSDTNSSIIDIRIHISYTATITDLCWGCGSSYRRNSERHLCRSGYSVFSTGPSGWGRLSRRHGERCRAQSPDPLNLSTQETSSACPITTKQSNTVKREY